MNEAQAILAMKELLKRPIAYHRAFARIGGGATCGLMLSQAWYWTPKADEDGWFYKTIVEWEEETGLTEAEQETARRKLVERGLMETKRAGMPARLYYRVKASECFRLLGQNTESSSGKTPNQVPVKHPNMIGQNSQPLIHRDYTETTTERESAPNGSENPEVKSSAVAAYEQTFGMANLDQISKIDGRTLDPAAWAQAVEEWDTNNYSRRNLAGMFRSHDEILARKVIERTRGKPIIQAVETPEQKQKRLQQIATERAQKPRQRTA